MAALYKRYIPPEPAASLTSASAEATSIIEVVNHAVTPEKKRKRERSQQEVAERKIKKLKKKGIDPNVAHQLGASSLRDVGSVENTAVAPLQQSDDNQVDATTYAQGDFAHIKSVKKRHKLEKAARAARKATEKSKGPYNDWPVWEANQYAAASASKQEWQSGQLAGGSYSMESPEAKQNSNRKSEGTIQGAKQPQSDSERRLQGSNPSSVPGTATGTVQEIVRPALQTTSMSVPGKRHHKLEAAVEEARRHNASREADSGHLRKHAVILDKFQKSAARSLQNQSEDSEQIEKMSHPVAHDLELPEQEEDGPPEFASDNDALPSWLAYPTIISTESRATFQDLRLGLDTAERLSKLGFEEALPVQQGLLPLLLRPGSAGSKFLPGTEPIVPDVAVSAPTGSGKTIAYLLPIVEALRLRRSSNKLSALIVVPTRELVAQVAAVAESLAKGSSIKVGMATSVGKLSEQKRKLVKRGRRYDPSSYATLMKTAKYEHYPPDELSSEFNEYIATTGQVETKRGENIRDAVDELISHVPTYQSTVDILVATPGRLLEHLSNSIGFGLAHLQWLVIDEADKLLDNEYEGFLEVLNAEINRPHELDEQDAREQYLRNQGIWDEQRERRLRKIILSATMTRDISKLTALRLHRPQLLIVRGAEELSDVGSATIQLNTSSSAKTNAGGYELPHTLVEYCVPVGDGSEKPLITAELLATRVLAESSLVGFQAKIDSDSESSDDSRSDSSISTHSTDSSELTSDDSKLSTESYESEDEAEENEHSSGEDFEENELNAARFRRLAAMAHRTDISLESQVPTVLIFASSNEAANRLSHLLKGMKPQWAGWISTLVKAKPGKNRIRSKLTDPAIVVSTDRAARGLDSFSNRPITHVIQYDVPRSLISYVHRVGRTARAGRIGDAWTLFTHSEARWFVNEVTKSKQIKRAGTVERVKVSTSDEQLRARYQKCLASMRDKVFNVSGK